jgi:PAS domain S-box-containing protein
MAAGVDPSARAAFEDTGLVLDALPRAVVVTDRGGLVLAWNAAARHLYGWGVDEVAGRPVHDVVVPAAPGDLTGEILATTLAGGLWRGEVSVVRRDGDVVRVRAAVSPLRAGDGAVVGTVGVAEDVTDLAMAERQAADLTEHLRLALAAGQLGTWRWDRATGAVTWDAAMERLYGLEPGTFDGTYDSWIALRGRDQERDDARATLDRAMADGEAYEIETEVVWPDGSTHWLHGWGRVTSDETGRPTGAIGCTADVTARKLAELAAEQRAAELADTARRERLQRERLAFLARITDEAITAGDHGEFMERVVRLAVPQLGDWCSVHFVPEPGAAPEVSVAHADPDKLAWINRLRREFPSSPDGTTGVAAVIRSGRSEFVPVVDEDFVQATLATTTIDRRQAREILDSLQLTSVITVPLQSKRGVLGAMQFVSAESGRRYQDEDLTLAEAAAGRVAETLSNLWLTQRQRSIADTLQAALLPPALPVVPGLNVAVRYWAAGAANDVGGDFYDLFATAPGRWAVVIGDVCGMGADGAAVTAIARHTIRAAATHGVAHRQVMEWLNDAVLAGRRDRFCTAIYATVEPQPAGGHELTVASGGHPLPILVRADGRAGTVGVTGTLIGVFAEVRSSTETVQLQPGDTVVLYTDGVTDQRPPHGLTAEEVAGLVQRAAAGAATADATAEALRAAIEAIRPIPDRGDDIALVVLRARLAD